MKKYNMHNNLSRVGFASLFALLLSLSSCTWGFDEINRSKDLVDEDLVGMDNGWAAFVQSMQMSIFSQDDNPYQRMDELHGNTFAGFHGQANYWGGNNSTTYVFAPDPGWHNDGFAVAYGTLTGLKYPVPGVMNTWNTLRQKADSTSVVFAVGEVVKVAGMHRLTDMYGPIPYIGFGKSMYAKYDSQKDIYLSFFKELDHAITILTDYNTVNPSAKPIIAFDMFLDSDIAKWVRFANSLKLRLAMRIRYVEPEMAKTHANAAVSHPLGVMESNDNNVKLGAKGKFSYVNPLTMLWKNYGETKMGAPMDAYLNAYTDPRADKYFTKVASGAFAGQYKGARFGVAQAADRYALSSTPKFEEDAQLSIMTASEVYFLRAEGALLPGWNMQGSAGELYEKGIQTSMSEWGVGEALVSAYISDAVSKPTAYTDISGQGNVTFNEQKGERITIKWEDNADNEVKLRRIMTQKWIALYPNGQEAWSEFRRTGYPTIFPTANNQNSGQVTDGFVKRIPLPSKEKLNNPTIYKQAIEDHFGGNEMNDNPGTKLWWDANPRVR